MRWRIRHIFVEGIVVLVVLVLLLITMIPHFRNARVNIHIAQSLSHLTAVTQSMKAYQVDHGSPGILRYRQSTYNGNPFESFIDTYHYAQWSNPHQGIQHLRSESVQAYFPAAETPKISEEQPGGFHVCEVTSHTWRSIFRDHYEQSAPPYPEWMYFDTQQSDYFGFTPGVRIDPNTITVHPERLNQERYSYENHYVSYDPTNGINSHGFITYAAQD